MPGFRVQSKLCSTYVFSNRSPISPERFEEVKAGWDNGKRVQSCHHSAVNTACRGHYEAARRGEIEHPIAQALSDATGLPLLPTADAMQISERLGLVEFIDDNTEDGFKNG